MCALQTMVIATSFRGSMPVFSMMRWVTILFFHEVYVGLIFFSFLLGMVWQKCYLLSLRIQNIMSCWTIVNMEPQWTMSSTPVTSLRRPLLLHLVASCQMCKALSVSNSGISPHLNTHELINVLKIFHVILENIKSIFKNVIWSQFLTVDILCSN